MLPPSQNVRSALIPGSVALVGATDRHGALGGDVLRNLLAGGFKGEIYAVNPKHSKVGGRRCYASLSELPTRPDLAVVVTPPAAVPQIVADAAARGVPGVVVLSAGFAEAGPAGRALQDAVLAQARQAGVRLIGPNCLGLMRPSIGLDASFARTPARAGSIGLVSQSGAVAAALLDYAWSAGFGFSSVVTTGDGSDVEFADLVDFLALDPQTRSIILYVEGVNKPRQFLSSLRAAASIKPVVVLKVGRHASGSKAALSHTGAMVGNDAVFDSALRRSGAIRISKYAQMFSAAEALTGGRLPRGSRLAVLTNGGGPGVLAADAAADLGITLAALGPDAERRLDAVLPSTWSKGNPIDIIGDADAPRFAQAFETVLADPANDGVLVLFCPTIRLASQDLAAALVPIAAKSAKPVVSAWLGEADAAQGRATFKQAGFAAMRSPEQGVESFAYLAQFVRNRELRLQLPPPVSRDDPDGAGPLQIDTARILLAEAQAESRGAARVVLSEDKAKAVLAACGIEVVQGQLATTAAQARQLADQIGYPVVLKVRAEGVTHKSEVGGVLLGLKSPEEVALGFELILERVRQRAPAAEFRGVLVQSMISRAHGRELIVGIARDPSFGPVISFGMGGIAVEVVRDSALALPPLNRVLAEDLIDRTRVATLLGAFRGMPPIQRDRLIDVLLRVSELACEFPCLAELDINPLLADESGVIALDARVVIDQGPLVPDPTYSHLAIHPYPKSLEHRLDLADGSHLLLRPVRPEDAEAQRRFVARLSDLTLYRRFHAPVRELSVDRLVRFTQIDFDREMAFVAIDTSGAVEEIRGFAQYNRIIGANHAEFGIAVEDGWQGLGLGYQMMAALEACGRARGIDEIFGYVLADNDSMRGMMLARGYVPHREEDDPGVVCFHRALAPAAEAPAREPAQQLA